MKRESECESETNLDENRNGAFLNDRSEHRTCLNTNFAHRTLIFGDKYLTNDTLSCQFTFDKLNFHSFCVRTEHIW